MNSWRLAWRNLQRNRARTWIAVVALAVSTTLLVVIDGLALGLDDLLTRGAINLGVGEAQVHAKTYARDESIYATLPNADAVIAAAKANGIDSAPRALGGGLLSTGENSTGARIWGVDPAAERSLGTLPGHLRAGGFLPDTNENRIVLGCELARLLGANVGDKIALIVQATDGSTSTQMMMVSGIFDTIGEVDTSLAMIDRRDFEELFVMDGKIHEIALSSHFRLAPEQVAALVTPAAGDAADVMTWRKALPAVDDISRLTRSFAGVLSTIFFIAAGLGLLNTILMATTERIREFGLVKALGAAPGRIIADVTRETFLLGILSAGVGGLIGVACTLLLARHGIDLRTFGKLDLGGVGLEPVWHSHPSARGIATPILGMVFVTLLAALYPAVVVARLTPVKALTHV